MQESEVLLKAADLIESDGWCQGHLSLQTGEHCMLGAILVVDPVLAHGLRSLQSLVSERYGMTPFEYNDTYGRTAQEVIDILKEAAITCREAEIK